MTVATPAIARLGLGPAWPAAAKASGTTTAMPVPSSANPGIATAGLPAATTSTPPVAATAPPSRTVGTGPSRRTTASPASRAAVMVKAKAV